MKRSQDRQKIFVCEFPDELDGFLEFCRGKNTDMDTAAFLIVPLEVEVRSLCREKGLPAMDTLPFFDSDSQRRLLMKSHKLTTLISGHLHLCPGHLLENGCRDNFIFYSRFYINHFLRLVEILEGIRQTYGEPEIFVCRRVRMGKTDSVDPLVNNRDRFLHSLADAFCRQKGLGIHVIDLPQISAVTGKKSRGYANSLLRHITRIVVKWKLRRLRRHPVVFAADTHYRLDRLCRDIRSRIPEIITVADTRNIDSPVRYLRVWRQLLVRKRAKDGENDPPLPIPGDIFNPADSIDDGPIPDAIGSLFRHFGENHGKYFIHHGCLFWNEFSRKVESDLLPFLIAVIDSAEDQRRFLDRLKPRLLLSAVGIAGFRSWGEVARSLGISACIIPQKGLVAPIDEVAATEESYIGKAQVSDGYDTAVSQSPLVSDFLNWSGYQGQIIETGNLIFSRITDEKRRRARRNLFPAIEPNTKVLVWAPSQKTRRSPRFFVLETDDELFSAMEDIFTVVAEMDNVHLVFRIHPGARVSKKTIYSLLTVPANVTVSNSGDFEDVLATADLLISFSSTAIQEALINRIPVLLYDRWRRYNHLAAPGLRGESPDKVTPVYYIDRKEDLRVGIDRLTGIEAGDHSTFGLFDQYIFSDNHAQNFYNFIRRITITDQDQASGNRL